MASLRRAEHSTVMVTALMEEELRGMQGREGRAENADGEGVRDVDVEAVPEDRRAGEVFGAEDREEGMNGRHTKSRLTGEELLQKTVGPTGKPAFHRIFSESAAKLILVIYFSLTSLAIWSPDLFIPFKIDDPKIRIFLIFQKIIPVILQCNIRLDFLVYKEMPYHQRKPVSDTLIRIH